MSSYAQAFYYPVMNPLFANKVVTSRTIAAPITPNEISVFEDLGALLALGLGDEYSLLLSKTDFSRISYNERMSAVFRLYKFISEGHHLHEDGCKEMAQALLLLFNKLLPESRLQYRAVPSVRKKVLKLDYTRALKSDISGVIFFRENFCGRKHELGFRLQEGLASQGWNVQLLSNEDAKIFTTLRQHDFGLFDIDIFTGLSSEQAFHTLWQFKRYFRKIIVLLPDPWITQCIATIEKISDMVDFVWGFTSDPIFTENPRFHDKVILFPSPSGFDTASWNKPGETCWDRCTYSFTGSIELFNISRVFWLLESICKQLPINFNITEPGTDDGLCRRESLEVYARQLSSTNVALNFTTRMDGTRIVIPGRAIEVISLGRLLIQETCPAFHSYFIEGEHFLEFSTVEELCTIVDFLNTHPGTAHSIAAAGYEFYREQYSSRKMVEYFQVLVEQ